MEIWKKNIPTKFEKNRTKPGNLFDLVMFENCTKPGTVQSETVLSGDPPFTPFLFYSYGISSKCEIMASSLSVSK